MTRIEFERVRTGQQQVYDVLCDNRADHFEMFYLQSALLRSVYPAHRDDWVSHASTEGEKYLRSLPSFRGSSSGNGGVNESEEEAEDEDWNPEEEEDGGYDSES
jgi:hypothetical protein